MTAREKNLAIIVLALVVGYGGWLAWGRWSEAVESRRRAIDSAKIAVSEAQLREAQASASLRRLEEFRDRSLPTDPQVAQSDYRAWLFDEFAQAGLEFSTVRRLSAPVDRGAYTSMTFKAQAEGDARAVTKFLHAFYRSRATHKLTQLKLAPAPTAGRLRLDADIEAILVAGASRTSGLPEDDSGRLRKATIDEYLASIAGRSLFAEYSPPAPPKPSRKAAPVASRPPADDSQHARFTGAVGGGAGMQAWVTVLTTGDVLRVSRGDKLKVGLLDARVVEVGASQLIYETDDERIRVPLGKKLREGKPVSKS